MGSISCYIMLLVINSLRANTQTHTCILILQVKAFVTETDQIVTLGPFHFIAPAGFLIIISFTAKLAQSYMPTAPQSILVLSQSYSISIDGLNHVAQKWSNSSSKVGHLVFPLGQQYAIVTYQIPYTPANSYTHTHPCTVSLPATANWSAFLVC